MTVHLLIPVGIVVALAAAIQAAVGFGFGLFAVPLLVWLGLPLPQAIGLGMGVVLCQTGWGVYRYREHTRWRATWPLVPARLLSMPVGVLALVALVGMGTERIKQVIGLVLLVVLVIQWVVRVEPKPTVRTRWAVIAGLFSGFLAGLTGMGGPPAVLWIVAHDWSSKRIRAAVWAIFLQTAPIQVALIWWKFGPSVLIAFAIGLAYMPLALLSASGGMKLGSLMSRQRLRVVAFTFLVLIALASIVMPLLHAMS